jgi:hypothetical protein
VIFPACTPAVQTELSSVYTPVPQTVRAVPPAGQVKTNRSPILPRNLCGSAFQPLPPMHDFGAAQTEADAPITTKLPCHAPYELLVIPFRVLPVYWVRAGRISIVTVPPLVSVMRPAWTAAVQTELSSV